MMPAAPISVPLVAMVLMWSLAMNASAEVKIPSLETSKLEAKLAGRVWVEELNCTACHQTTANDLASSSRAAPRLANVRGRMQPDFITAFVANPSAIKPGTLMPDVLGEFAREDRGAAAKAITHFLISLGKPANELTLQAPDGVAAERGEKLFHTVGCVACHSPRDPSGKEMMSKSSVPLGDLEGKYSIRSLTEFLKRPHEARPSLRMPEMALPDADVERIAHYLLRKTKVPGHLAYTMWRGQVWEGLDGAVEKERAGLVDDFSLERIDAKKVPQNIAIRYEGFLKIDRAGDYLFHVEMNGGTLRLNGAEVIAEAPSNRRGVKSLQGKAMLREGWNRIELTYFHTGREPGFRVEMEGPGFARGPISPERLSVSEQPIPKFQPIQPDATLVAKGKALVERFNCAKCHVDLREIAPPARASFPALAKLDSTKGCLADVPAKDVPHFDLGADKKALMRASLPAIETEKLSDAQVIHKTLVALSCVACHERKGLSEMDPARDAYFTGTREALGNQGRIPPPLTQVGAKLTPEWMAEVLLHGGRQRYYLNTRMPQFGEANVGHLIERFGKVDSLEEAAIPKVANIQESKQAGYAMIGAEGFSCIACHDFNGQKSAGAGALDMVGVTQRLKKNWFHLYMREPYRFHPTGIMPAYWPGGQSVRKEVLSGDTAQQIEALWNYLSDGGRVKAPKGLSRQSQELRVADEAIICRGRGTVAGFRAIGVGYPEKISLVFDSEQMSLRMLWRGEFADADTGSFRPRSRDLIEFPPGIPFHRLASMDSEWPYKGKTDYAFPQDHGYQFLGYQLDKTKRPTFRYRYGEVTVEDFFEDRRDAAGQAFFRRTLKFSAPSTQSPFYFRVAAGKAVNGSGKEWNIDRLKVRLLGHLTGKMREGEPAELLVPLELRAGETVIQLEYQ
jgi:mono/diheme cytochrome c family protein